MSLVLLGGGPQRDEILQRVGKLGLSRHVILAGFRQYHELPLVYGLASVFIHASTVDQWGLVVNEAMAAGLPVLVSHRCGCAPDLVREGVNGWMFDPLDTGSLASLMGKLASLSEGERQTLGRGSRRLVADWSLQRFVEGALSAVATARGRVNVRPKLIEGPLLRAIAQQRG